MLSFKRDFFFIKFSILFFIITIFGYWGLDLNSEELYIAFSFFLLVIVAFNASRTAMLVFFLNTINKKYSRAVVDLNRIRIILARRSFLLREICAVILKRKTYVILFLKFIVKNLLPLLIIKSQVYKLALNKFLMSLTVNLNFFIATNTQVRRLSGFFLNSSRFFSIFL